MTTELGLREWQAGWRIAGEFDAGRLMAVLNGLIREVGMTPAGAWDVRFYTPQQEANGGLGVQGYRDLVESWIIFSTWPEHGFIRVNLSSCRPFDFERAGIYLRRHLGEILVKGSMEL